MRFWIPQSGTSPELVGRQPRHLQRQARMQGSEHARAGLRAGAHYEEEVEAVDDGVDAEHRLPILAQNVQADVALQVDVRMIHLLRKQVKG